MILFIAEPIFGHKDRKKPPDETSDGFSSVLLVIKVLFHEFLQKNRRNNGSNDDHQHDWREQLTAEEAHVVALLRNDQCDFTSGYHADTDMEGIAGAEFADFCAQSAAENLCDYSNDKEQYGENKHGCCHTGKFCLDSDTCEEYRGKEQIAWNGKFPCNVGFYFKGGH